MCSDKGFLLDFCMLRVEITGVGKNKEFTH